MIDVESAVSEPETAPRRKPGRPRKLAESPEIVTETAPEVEVETDRPQPPETIPPCPTIPKKLPLQPLLDYWNNTLSQQQREWGALYLYRDWPAPKRENRRNKFVNPNCEKFSSADGTITKQMIWQRRRTGIYRLKLSQWITRPTGEVCEAEFELPGDYTNPEQAPIIAPEDVDDVHPSNLKYVKYLKSRGLIKPGEGEEEEDMSTNAVIVGKLLDHALEQKEQPEPQPHQPQPAPDTSVGKELVGLLREQIQQNRPPESQGTVADHVRSLVDLAKTMTPAAPPKPDMQPLMEMQKQNQALLERIMMQEVERAKAETLRAQEEASRLRAAIPPPKTLDEQFDDLERAARRYNRIRGKDPDEVLPPETITESPMAGFFGNLPAILEKITPLWALTANMLYNWKVNGSGAPPVSPSTNQPSTQPEAPDMSQALSPEMQERMEQMQSLVNMVGPIAGPLLKAFAQQKSGADFAKQASEMFGGPEIEAIQQAVQEIEGGQEAILRMLQQYPQAWNQIKGELPRFNQFLREFLSYQPAPVN